MSLFEIIFSYSSYKKDLKELTDSYIRENKSALKTKILEIKDFINWNRNKPIYSIKKIIEKNKINIKKEVQQSFEVGSIKKEPDNLKQFIIPLYVADKDGNILFQSKSVSESDNEIDNSLKANYISKKNKGEGYTLLYTKDPHDSILQSVVYYNSNLLPPYTVYSFISKFHFETIVKDYLLDSISNIRFNGKNYVFVNTINGYALITRGLKLKEPLNILNDKKWKAIFDVQKQSETIYDGIYYSYRWKKEYGNDTVMKFAYFNYLPDYKWIIGAGFYEDDMKNIINQKRRELYENYMFHIIKNVFILLVLYLICIIIMRHFSKIMKRDVGLFDEFFNEISASNKEIDVTLFHYLEFKKMAISANKMIQQRKQDYEQLQINEQKFRSVFDSSPVGKILVEATTGQILTVNKKFIEYFGYTNEEIPNADVWFQTVYPNAEYRDQLIKEWRDRLQRALDEHKTVEQLDVKITCKDNSIKTVQISASVLGNLIVVTFVDLTYLKNIESELKINENKFEIAFENAPVGMSIINPEGKYLAVNNLLCKMFGYTKEEYLSDNILIVTHPDDQERSIAWVKKRMAGDDSEPEIEKRFINKNGEIVWGIVRAQWIKDKAGIPQMAVSHILDITEKKRAEEIIEKEKKKTQMFQEALDDVSSCIYIKNVDLKYVHANNTTLQLFNVTLKELEGMSDIDFFDTNTVKTLREIDEKVIKENVSVTTEIVVPIKGELHYFFEQKRPIYDGFGNISGLCGISTDITELKKNEQKIIESEERFRTLFEHVVEGVALHEMVYDNEGKAIDYRIIDVNPSYKNHTGLDRASAAGKLGTELYGTSEPPYLVEFGAVAETRNPYRFDTYFAPMEKHFNISVVSPKKGQFATVFEDVTDRIKKEEELKQKNEEMARFIYTVSHDLKSPLVTIKAFSSYLKEDIEQNQQESINRDIDFIQNATDKMGILLNELLELSRIGRIENVKQEYLLESIISEVEKLLAGRISLSHVKINKRIDSVYIFGDYQRLFQVFQNLIDNSIKFMGDQKSPEIEIGIKTEMNQQVIYIKDNGMGIDPRYHHKMFGLFEKLNKNSEGTGVGLALVKRIIEVHNGKIWFESEGENKGTTFYFTLEKTRINNA